MNFSRNTYLEVDKEKIKNNIKKAMDKHSEYKYYFGVVKANCYGCDDNSLQLTKAIAESGCNYLAVATLDEALKIREKLTEIPIRDRYSNGSYIIKDKIKSSYLESTMLTKEDFQNLEYVEDKKSEQVELNFDMLNKESLKQIDDKMVIINNFLDNVEDIEEN